MGQDFSAEVALRKDQQTRTYDDVNEDIVTLITILRSGYGAEDITYFDFDHYETLDNAVESGLVQAKLYSDDDE